MKCNKHIFHYEKDLMTLHPCQRQRKCRCQSCPNSSSSGCWDLNPHSHQQSIPVACVPLLSFTFFRFWYWLKLSPHKIRSLMPAYRIIHKKNGQQLLDSMHFSGNQQDRVTWRRLCVEFPVWALAIDRGRAIILRTKAATEHCNAAPLKNQMTSLYSLYCANWLTEHTLINEQMNVELRTA